MPCADKDFEALVGRCRFRLFGFAHVMSSTGPFGGCERSFGIIAKPAGVSLEPSLAFAPSRIQRGTPVTFVSNSSLLKHSSISLRSRSSPGTCRQARQPGPRVNRTPHMGRISISDATGIGFGQRLTHATASSMEGNSQSQ